MRFEDWNKIHEYCMSKPCAYETRPFGEDVLCYRLAGKIFAQLSGKEEWFKITLKTNPESAEFYRRIYPGVVVRGYHCPPVQQPYWNTIDLNQFELDRLYDMIDEAYDEIWNKLSKKEKARMPEIASYRFVKTDGTNKDFVELCTHLDAYLDEIAKRVIDRTKYIPHNQLDSIHDVIVVYQGEMPVGCGSYKLYDDETVELKRIFLDASVRGKGLSKELIRRLEADARIAGFRYAVLETGDLLVEASSLYKKMGYKVIPNYGPYKDMPESVCMQKKL